MSCNAQRRNTARASAPKHTFDDDQLRAAAPKQARVRSEPEHVLATRTQQNARTQTTHRIAVLRRCLLILFLFVGLQDDQLSRLGSTKQQKQQQKTKKTAQPSKKKKLFVVFFLCSVHLHFNFFLSALLQQQLPEICTLCVDFCFANTSLKYTPSLAHTLAGLTL